MLHNVNMQDFIHLPYMMGKNLDSILEEYPKIVLQLGESQMAIQIRFLIFKKLVADQVLTLSQQIRQFVPVTMVVSLFQLRARTLHINGR